MERPELQDLPDEGVQELLHKAKCRQRRWACAVLLRGRPLEIEARERNVLSSLRAFNHPEFRGVSSRV